MDWKSLLEGRAHRKASRLASRRSQGTKRALGVEAFPQVRETLCQRLLRIKPEPCCTPGAARRGSRKVECGAHHPAARQSDCEAILEAAKLGRKASRRADRAIRGISLRLGPGRSLAASQCPALKTLLAVLLQGTPPTQDCGEGSCALLSAANGSFGAGRSQ